MSGIKDQTDKLFDQVEILKERQRQLGEEIHQLHREIRRIKNEAEVSTQEIVQPMAVVQAEDAVKTEPSIAWQASAERVRESYGDRTSANASNQDEAENESSLEKYIGENIISKAGIIITIIGVAIGVKYSIDHQLISPVMRIILGYLAGLVLLLTGLRLKKRYLNYSSILVSGSLAALYFVTYAAFGFYQLLPQLVAFATMVVITILGVTMALNYDKEIISLFGLVGAYAIPFLLGGNSASFAVLFGYIFIINAGILVISVRRYWQKLFYASFLITWLIFFSWFITHDHTLANTELALTFSTLYFLLFYLTFLAFKLYTLKAFDLPDIILLLANSAIYFGFGYAALQNTVDLKMFTGIFSMANALIHAMVCLAIHARKQTDRNLLHFIFGLALAFVTLAIPVQLHGNWITIFWSVEAALLFWIGRSKGSQVYEWLSYPVMVLCFFSLLPDWATGYMPNHQLKALPALVPLWNLWFLTSLFVVASLGIILYLHRNPRYASTLGHQKELTDIFSLLLPAAFLFVLYFTFFFELTSYWEHKYADSLLRIGSGNAVNLFYNADLVNFKAVWLVNYTLLFCTLLSWFCLKKMKERQTTLIILTMNGMAILLFLTLGLYNLGELRESYLTGKLAPHFEQTAFNIGIRYLCYLFPVLLVYLSYLLSRQPVMEGEMKQPFDFLLYTTLGWMLSSEVVNWMEVAGSQNSYKLGISILWGIYSLFLISLGIWKQKKYLRIGAIGLFTVTLLKLFFYDLSKLDTISKTIVFLSLGVLLLVISFIYNKYRNLLSD